MTAIEFTPTEERILAYYFGAKVRDGKFPLAKDAAAAFGTTPGAIRTMLSKLRKKGIRVGAPVGRHSKAEAAAEVVHPVEFDPASDLTPKQFEILRFIASYRNEHGITPTLREIAGRFGFTSPSGALCHMRVLARKGWVKQAGAGRARAYVLAKEVAA